MKHVLLACLFSILPCTTLFGMDPAEQKDITDCLSACTLCDTQVVTKLLRKGVDPNTRLYPPLVEPDYAGTTFLHFSTQSPEITEMLLQAGAIVNAQNEEEQTPLHFAACSTKPKTVEVLLEHGADPGLTDLGGNNPLHEITRCAAQGFLGWRLPCHEKIQRGCKIIELLKEKGVPSLLQNRILATPFHNAAASNNVDIVLSLLLPAYSQETPSALRKDAKSRLCAFLLCNQRNGNTGENPQFPCEKTPLPVLPSEVVLRIFSYMPLDCKHAGIEEKIVPHFMRKENFKALCVQEIKQKDDLIPYLKQVISNIDQALLEQTLLTPNLQGRTPQQLATDPRVQELLAPNTWALEKECCYD